jgi:hypothetical protein
MVAHPDDQGIDLDPVPAVVLRADEPVPASIVHDERDTFVKRLGIAILAMLALAFTIIGYRQSASNGAAISTLKIQLGHANHQLEAARNRVNKDAVAAHKAAIKVHRTDVRFFHLLQRQDVLLIRAGLAPISLVGLAPGSEHKQHKTPPSGGNRGPDPKPTPHPTATHRTPPPHKTPTPHPTPSPRPSPIASLVCRILIGGKCKK